MDAVEHEVQSRQGSSGNRDFQRQYGVKVVLRFDMRGSAVASGRRVRRSAHAGTSRKLECQP